MRIPYYLVVVFLFAFSPIETNQQLDALKINICENNNQNNIKACSIGFKFNYINCTCDAIPLNERIDNVRLANSFLVSKLITSNFASSASSHKCSNNNEKWNGSDCILSHAMCPGGYQWNGNDACVMQLSLRTHALVPLPPDKKCKHAQNAQSTTTPATTTTTTSSSAILPIFITSPSCSFGFIWENNECQKSLPICPENYVYLDGECHLKSIDSFVDGNKWLQKPTNLKKFDSSSAQILSIPKPSISSLFGSSLHSKAKNSKIDSIDPNKWLQKPSFEIDESVKFEPIESDLTVDEIAISSLHDQPCCIISSPRICRQISPKIKNRWQCFHHTNQRCGSFCSKSKVFLRPQKSIYSAPLLIMPPAPHRLSKLLQRLSSRDKNIGKI